SPSSRTRSPRPGRGAVSWTWLAGAAYPPTTPRTWRSRSGTACRSRPSTAACRPPRRRRASRSTLRESSQILSVLATERRCIGPRVRGRHGTASFLFGRSQSSAPPSSIRNDPDHDEHGSNLRAWAGGEFGVVARGGGENRGRVIGQLQRRRGVTV